MIYIQIGNVKSQVTGGSKDLGLLYQAMKVRHPNAFYLKQHMSRYWDGYIDYLKESGSISTGLLPQLLEFAKNLEIKVKLLDQRRDIKLDHRVPDSVGDKVLRPYQKEVITACALNQLKYGDQQVFFPRGLIKAATNSGKTLIAAGIHVTLGHHSLFVVNNKDLFQQMVEEMEELIPGEVGYINADGIEWNNFMVCMVATLKNRLPSIREEISAYGCVFVDECDLTDNKTFKAVMDKLPNAYARYGLSGSVLVSPLKKDLPKNYNIQGMFGAKLSEITNQFLMQQGHSSQVIVKMIGGNTNGALVDNTRTYREAYELGVVNNIERNRAILGIIEDNLKHNRHRGLIICRERKHIIRLWLMATSKFPNLRIKWVDHTHSKRFKYSRMFKAGKIDILIASYILKRGKNFPLTNYVVNASGGKGAETVLQILGRATRHHESKEFTLMYDFMDQGRYLAQHSKRRLIVYKNEKLQVEN